LRFLLPKKSVGNLYYDRDLIVYARAIYLADQWKETDAAYRPLHTTYQTTHLRPRLRELFDTFAILDVWNFAQPEQCRFLSEKHNATGDRIPKAIHEKIEKELFDPQEFDTAALAHAASSASLARFVGELQEPSINGQPCIPWLGEVAARERVLRLCAAGRLAIDWRGLEMLQALPGENEDAAWLRLKGKLGSGKELEQTILLRPGATPHSGGAVPATVATVPPPGLAPVIQPGGTSPSNLFGGLATPTVPLLKPFGTLPKTPVNLLGEVEKWGISSAMNVTNVNLNVSQMTGAQLTELLKNLPDGMSYSLNLEKVAQ